MPVTLAVFVHDHGATELARKPGGYRPGDIVTAVPGMPSGDRQEIKAWLVERFGKQSVASPRFVFFGISDLTRKHTRVIEMLKRGITNDQTDAKRRTRKLDLASIPLAARQKLLDKQEFLTFTLDQVKDHMKARS